MKYGVHKLFAYLMLTLPFIPTHSEWKVVTAPALPYSTHDMAIGLYADWIYLLGGSNSRYQLTKYDWDLNYMYDYGNETLPQQVHGWHYAWYGINLCAQIDNKLFLIDYNSNIAYFDLSTRRLYHEITYLYYDIQQQGCIASTDDHLYITGGWNGGWSNHYMNIVQICEIRYLSALTITCTHDIPHVMLDRRSFHSCMVVDNYLYVIGGYDGTNHLDSVERINLNNINDVTAQGFQHILVGGIVQKLSVSLSSIGCVLYGKRIWLFGGIDNQHIPRDIVHILNTTSGEIAVHSQRLPYGVSSVAPIIANDILYLFGGYIGNQQSTNTWMSYDLIVKSTTDPTINPTDYHSADPSVTPTNNPSNSPTRFLSPSLTTSSLTNWSITTVAPTHAVTMGSTMSETSQTTIFQNKIETEPSSLVMILCVVIGGLVVIICIGGIYFVYNSRKKQVHSDYVENMELNEIQQNVDQKEGEKNEEGEILYDEQQMTDHPLKVPIQQFQTTYS
eukprot:85987_1